MNSWQAISKEVMCCVVFDLKQYIFFFFLQTFILYIDMNEFAQDLAYILE